MQTLQAQLQWLAPARALQHGNGNFLQHLFNVYQILTVWSCDSSVCTAGLFHSVYGTEFFKSPVFDLHDRSKLSEVIGTPAEILVYAFCRLKRSEIITAAVEAKNSQSPVVLEEANRSASFELTRVQLNRLLAIEMANLYEQLAASDRSPVLILERLRRLADAGAEIGSSHPIYRLRDFSELKERDALQYYRQSIDCVPQQADKAQALLLKTIECLQITAEPYVLAAAIHLDQNRFAEALALADQAARLFDQWGYAWDKRLSLSDWRMVNERIIKLATLGVHDAELWPRLCQMLQTA